VSNSPRKTKRVAPRDDRRDRARRAARRALLRPRQIQDRLGVGKTKFWDLVHAGRIKLVRIGPKSVACPEHEIDALIDEMMATRDSDQIAATG
jgi:predicted DNA-binding transcriptional regulator AlpA